MESILLHFRPDREMSQRILERFISHPGDMYFGPPVQCFRCQRCGHITRLFRGPQRCKVCAGGHNHQKCTSRQEVNFANCGGGNSAAFSWCPCKKATSTMRKKELVNGRESRTQVTILNPDVASPPPPSTSLNGRVTKKLTYYDILTT